jgi:hypothetical protein
MESVVRKSIPETSAKQAALRDADKPKTRSVAVQDGIDGDWTYHQAFSRR